MSEEETRITTRQHQASLAAALGLAILGGFGVGMYFVLRQLPTRHLSRADLDRLLFYRYLREKGKLES